MPNTRDKSDESRPRKWFKRILKAFLLVFLILLVALVSFLIFRPKPPRPPDTVSNIEELEVYLQELIDFGSPPGLTLVVAKGEDIVYQKGFGLVDGPQAVSATADSIYRWWSVTKLFTATAILQLHEQGKLELDTPVTTYLDFFDPEYPTLPLEHFEPVVRRIFDAPRYEQDPSFKYRLANAGLRTLRPLLGQSAADFADSARERAATLYRNTRKRVNASIIALKSLSSTRKH